jgi:glutamate transport system permease protein
VVITIFFVWAWLPTIGAATTSNRGPADAPLAFDNPMGYLVIGLTIYNSVVIGEILRSGMEGIPTGQREAAAALGLSPFQAIRLILLPQAFRVMLPALISQLVVVLKDTSLGFIISYEEVLRVSSQIVGVLNNPIQVYTVVGVAYIAVNYALSRLAQYVQRRFSRRRSAGVSEPSRSPWTRVPR